MRTALILSRHTNFCKKITLKLRIDKTGKAIDTASKHKLANSLARDWGIINWQETIFNKGGYLLKNYGCSGHGGYILISDKELNGLQSDYNSREYNDPSYFDGAEFWTYIFEEDCEWAKLYKILDKDLFAIVENKWKKNLTKEPQKPLSEHAEESLEKWNKDFNFNNPITKLKK